MFETYTDLQKGISKITLRVKTEFVRMSKWMLEEREFAKFGDSGSFRFNGWIKKKTTIPFVILRSNFRQNAYLVDVDIEKADIDSSIQLKEELTKIIQHLCLEMYIKLTWEIYADEKKIEYERKFENGEIKKDDVLIPFVTQKIIDESSRDFSRYAEIEGVWYRFDMVEKPHIMTERLGPEFHCVCDAFSEEEENCVWIFYSDFYSNNLEVILTRKNCPYISWESFADREEAINSVFGDFISKVLETILPQAAEKLEFSTTHPVLDSIIKVYDSKKMNGDISPNVDIEAFFAEVFEAKNFFRNKFI